MEPTKRIIAIETSGRHGSVALLWGDGEAARLIKQTELTGNERTAQSLAPALGELLNEVGWPMRSVELIAVAAGPGSFTGLRIGVTTAKTLAYATGAELVAVNTLEAIAAQIDSSPSPLWAIVDAQRQELFAAKFEFDAAGWPRPLQETSIVPQETWLSGLEPGDHVMGPALRRLAARMPKGVTAVAQESWQPMAAAVGRVGWKRYRAGERTDLWQLVPNYYRASAAEEKLR
jgi:tRNA threonylcarbamoyladenosine biosynthesis protein TsaB